MSEFKTMVDDVFGESLGAVLVTEHILFELDNRSATTAIADGLPVRRVWAALCDDFDIAENRRWEPSSGPRPRRAPAERAGGPGA